MEKPKESRNINKKTVLALGLIFSLILAWAVYSQNSSYFMPGIVSPYAFTIYPEESIYYAKNAYGLIEYSGTSASEVSELAINTLTKGGIVLFKAGTYMDISFKVTLDAVIITGELFDNKYQPTGTSGTIFDGDDENPMITINGTTGTIIENIKFGRGGGGYESNNIGVYAYDVQAFTLRNCLFIGTKKEAFYGSYIRNALIDKCYFGACGSTTIKGESSNISAVRITYSDSNLNNDVTCRNCYFYNNAWKDMYLSGLVDYSGRVDKCYFHGTESEGKRYPSHSTIDVDGHFEITNCYLSVGGDFAYIYSNGAYGLGISNCFLVNGYTFSDYGIYIFNSSSKLEIENNHLLGFIDDGIYLETTSSSVIGNIVEFCNDSGIVIVGTRVDVSNNILLDNGRYPGTHLGAGIFLSNAQNIILDANLCTNYNYMTQVYGIYESGTSDYNIITSCNTRESVTAGIILSGSNSHCNLCWNGSTWIS